MMIIIYVSNSYGLFGLLVKRTTRMIFDIMRGVKAAASAYIGKSEF